MFAARQRLTEAEQELLIILKNHPGDYRSRNNLAGIYRSTGRIDEAIDQMEALVGQRPGYVTGWQNLGQLYLDVRDWKKAEEAFRKAVHLKNDNALAHFNLARVLRAVGRTAEAEQEMKMAISLDPRLARLKNP
jgi:tetratricopeptide (TPR) repeat protein